jgi:hypothetical protein
MRSACARLYWDSQVMQVVEELLGLCKLEHLQDRQGAVRPN